MRRSSCDSVRSRFVAIAFSRVLTSLGRITEVGCSYALIGHTSRPGRVDSKGKKLSAQAVVLDGEKFKGMYLSAAPQEHASLFAESLRKAMPPWTVELNTTYRDEYSALRRNFKALGIPVLTLVLDETLFVVGGRVEVGRLNSVRYAVAEAFNTVLTEFPV